MYDHSRTFCLPIGENDRTMKGGAPMKVSVW